MRILTKEYLDQFDKSLGAVKIGCKDHPDSNVEAFFDVENHTLCICCAQCEKIIIEQPLP